MDFGVNQLYVGLKRCRQLCKGSTAEAAGGSPKQNAKSISSTALVCWVAWCSAVQISSGLLKAGSGVCRGLNKAWNDDWTGQRQQRRNQLYSEPSKRLEAYGKNTSTAQKPICCYAIVTPADLNVKQGKPSCIERYRTMEHTASSEPLYSAGVWSRSLLLDSLNKSELLASKSFWS